MSLQLDYSRYYSRYHTDSPESQRWEIDFSARLLSAHLPDDRAVSVLDVGCGMGFTMLYLLEDGFDYVEGIDVDAGQVQSCLGKGLRVYQVGDSAQFVEKQGRRYGLIVAMDVLEHMAAEDQLALVRASYQALLPSGRFICTVPNANSSMAARHRYNDFTHHVSFTEQSLDFLLFNAGFRQIEVSGYEFYQPPHEKGLGLQHFARRRHFLSYLAREYTRWGLRAVARGWRRLEMVAEFGFDTGGSVPLSLNLLGVAIKE